MKYSASLPALVACASLVALSGCAAFTSTTDTAADAAQTITHGISASIRSTTDVSSGDTSDSTDAETHAYMQSQMPQIRREAAAGGGEHIDALARLMDDQPSNTQSNDLGPWMQSHYDQLFTGDRSVDSMIGDIQSRRG